LSHYTDARRPGFLIKNPSLFRSFGPRPPAVPPDPPRTRNPPHPASQAPTFLDNHAARRFHNFSLFCPLDSRLYAKSRSRPQRAPVATRTTRGRPAPAPLHKGIHHPPERTSSEYDGGVHWEKLGRDRGLSFPVPKPPGRTAVLRTGAGRRKKPVFCSGWQPQGRRPWGWLLSQASAGGAGAPAIPELLPNAPE
jgi:hypothetical protein